MKINKQLFEDVLSGKLKGTFVTTNRTSISSDKIQRNINKMSDFPYQLKDNLYKQYNVDGTICPLFSYHFDLVAFIPDTNMKENELTIEIPNDKVVDWDESKKQNRIVLKDKQLNYKDICKKLFVNKEFFFTNSTGIIESSSSVSKEYLTNAANNSTSYHQLECIMAKNMLANTAKYLNDGWKPDKTDTGNFDAWVLYLTPNKDYIGYLKIGNCGFNSNVLFKSKEIAQQAVKILGEETVKLALEPLGI